MKLTQSFNKKLSALLLALVVACSLSGCTQASEPVTQTTTATTTQQERSSGESAESTNDASEGSASQFSAEQENTAPDVSTFSIPAYSGSPYVEVNNNVPQFSDASKTTHAFEVYGELDSLGRVTGCFANVCKELMPTGERGDISSVKPTGWVQKQYKGIQTGWLYNRCHLIGWQLTSQNANPRNILTGTRYFNVSGMLPFENKVANYVKSTNHHVLYRATPHFEGNDLVCKGIQLEAYSVEDNGAGLSYNVFVFNVQPNIEIDYATGNSKVASSAPEKNSDNASGGTSSSSSGSGSSSSSSSSSSSGSSSSSADESKTLTLVLNTSTKKAHLPGCSAIKSMSEKNKKNFTGTLAEVLRMGYSACKKCNPW